MKRPYLPVIAHCRGCHGSIPVADEERGRDVHRAHCELTGCSPDDLVLVLPGGA